MDDGWFKGRNTDTTSLGDWTEDKKKFPDGLQSLAKKVKQKGIDFGIWFEPEMISKESDLYREHPDWVIRSPLYESNTQPTSAGYWICRIRQFANI